MTQVNPSDEGISKLRTTTNSAEYFESSRDVVGTDALKQDLSEYDLECPTPLEELNRRSREESGRPLADIYRDRNAQSVSDENSSVVREWMRNVKPTISEEEMRRRETAGDGISTSELLARLKDRKKD